MGKELITSALLGGIGCYCLVYWMNAAICDHITLSEEPLEVKVYLPLGIKVDKVTFAFTLLTSLMAFCAIAIMGMRERSCHFGKISMGLVLLILVFWLACTIVYATRTAISDQDVKDGKASILSQDNIGDHNYRKWDIVRGVFMVIFAAGALVLQFLDKHHK